MLAVLTALLRVVEAVARGVVGHALGKKAHASTSMGMAVDNRKIYSEPK